jgi:hypothetical protein
MVDTVAVELETAAVDANHAENDTQDAEDFPVMNWGALSLFSEGRSKSPLDLKMTVELHTRKK